MLQGCSHNRAHHEIWTMSDKVLCFQSSPEINKTYIKDLIITKLYDGGEIDESQKNMSLEQIDDEMIPMSRHFIMKCINSFIRYPN